MPVDIHDSKLNVVILDLLLNLINTVTVHDARAIGDQHNLALVFKLLAVGTNHLNGNDN